MTDTDSDTVLISLACLALQLRVVYNCLEVGGHWAHVTVAVICCRLCTYCFSVDIASTRLYTVTSCRL